MVTFLIHSYSYATGLGEHLIILHINHQSLPALYSRGKGSTPCPSTTSRLLFLPPYLSIDFLTGWRRHVRIGYPFNPSDNRAILTKSEIPRQRSATQKFRWVGGWVGVSWHGTALPPHNNDLLRSRLRDELRNENDD